MCHVCILNCLIFCKLHVTESRTCWHKSYISLNLRSTFLSHAKCATVYGKRVHISVEWSSDIDYISGSILTI